jgi:hypothetical protein
VNGCPGSHLNGYQRRLIIANNYTQFSEQIVDLKPQERDWLRKVLSLGGNAPADGSVTSPKPVLMKELGIPHMDDYDFDAWPDFQWELEPTALWIYAEENGETEHVAQLFRAFLRKFRPREMLVLRYAETCSKMRLGEFSGGAYVVMAKSIHHMNASGWVRNIQKRFPRFKWNSVS